MSGRSFAELSDENNVAAARATESLLGDAIERAQDIAVETVLSTDKCASHIERARGRGYRIGLIFVLVSDPEVAIRRVRLRVSAGGHDVPEEKIRERWKRSLDQALNFVPKVDQIVILGNDPALPYFVAQGVASGWLEGSRVELPVLRAWLDRLAAEWRRTHPA